MTPIAVDPAGVALLLEPGQVLAPGDEVVHLLDLDPAEEAPLGRVLRAALVDRVGPDLRRHDAALAPSPRSASPSDASAAPYIGDESNTVVPARRAPPRRPPSRAPRRRSERAVRAEADDRAEAPLLPSRPSSARASPARRRTRHAKNHGSSSGPAAHVREREARARVAPARRRRPRRRRRARVRRSRPAGQATSCVAEHEPQSRAACGERRRDGAPAGRRAEYRTTTIARPPSAAAAFAASATARPPWPKRGAGADDARPDRRRRRTSKPCAFAQASAEADGQRLHVAVEARRDRDRRLEQAAASSGRRTRVRERHRQRAAAELRDRRRARPSPIPATTGASWLCSPQQTTGSPSRIVGERARCSSTHGAAAWPGVYGSAITWAPSGGASAQPPRQVRVERRRSRRAELEVARLGVDEHRVADLDRPGLPRVRDAGRPVDLAADQLVEALRDGRDGAPAQASAPRHASRAASTIASVTSTMPSRSATAMCSSGVWMSVIPFARFTHGRPRSLKTFASAPPPENVVVGS